ncbi:MAG: endonuclease [Psychromonas sp.]|nr:endonuclease [Psychromonas sp.]
MYLHNKNYLILLFFTVSFSLQAKNVTNDSFSKTKHLFEQFVYTNDSERYTIYCDAKFTKDKVILPPTGFSSNKFAKRAKRMEWEHVVPAENFGRNFRSWREGNRLCITSKGKHYKGRRCANKVSEDYKLMQADMYNLYPAIGAVNAMRSNYNFQASVPTANTFGTCAMHIRNHKVEPPKSARGEISRSYLYMSANYSHFKLSKQQKKLMQAWNKQYPAGRWECKRGELIQKLQKNRNKILEASCNRTS